MYMGRVYYGVTVLLLAIPGNCALVQSHCIRRLNRMAQKIAMSYVTLFL